MANIITNRPNLFGIAVHYGSKSHPALLGGKDEQFDD